MECKTFMISGEESMDLGERLAQIREDQELSQSALARMVGTSQSAISQIEAGERNPSYEMIRKLAGALAVTPSYLVGEDLEELSKEEQVHFREYRGLTEEAKQELKEFMAYLRHKRRGRPGGS